MARTVLTLLLCGAIAAFAMGCGLGEPNEAAKPVSWSDASRLRAGERFFPPGKRLYWLGPTVGDFHLVGAFRPAASDPGVELAYAWDDQILSLQTYRGSTRPTGGADFSRAVDVVASVVTPTDQLVVLSFRRGYPRASQATVERLRRLLKPLTSGEIDRLPGNWIEIPHS